MTTKKESTLYYFTSTGCAFCKRIDPIIEKLNEDGYNILRLDLIETDNQGLKKELENKYNKRCGTPWLIDASNGNNICGAATKENIQKWVNGETIPAPPKPKGMPPRPPFMQAPDAEVKEWKTNYNKWLDDNQHLPEDRRKSVDEILSMPRPKSEPPRPPMGPDATEEGIDGWGEQYKKWSKENSHMPNLQPADKIVQNFKNRMKQMANNPNAPTGGQPQPQAPSPKIAELEKRVAELENKLNSVVDQGDVVEEGLTEWEEDMEYKLDALLNHLGVQI